MAYSEAGPLRKKRRAGWIIVLITVLALVLSGIAVFLNIGRWLVKQDPLSKADAIVVLSGRMPVRAMEAARLYNAGYAPQVWLTRPSEPAAALQEMHIAYIGEDFYNTRILMHEGVPSNAIHLLESPIANTAEEVKATAGEMQRIGATRVIIVTSRAHTRRVGLLWRDLSHGAGQAFVRASSTDSFVPERWWRSTTDVQDVVRETLGLINAWAGLPLEPAR